MLQSSISGFTKKSSIKRICERVSDVFCSRRGRFRARLCLPYRFEVCCHQSLKRFHQDIPFKFQTSLRMISFYFRDYSDLVDNPFMNIPSLLSTLQQIQSPGGESIRHILDVVLVGGYICIFITASCIFLQKCSVRLGDTPNPNFGCRGAHLSARDVKTFKCAKHMRGRYDALRVPNGRASARSCPSALACFFWRR